MRGSWLAGTTGAWQSGQQAYAREQQAAGLAEERNALRPQLARLNVDLQKERQQVRQAREKRLADQQSLAGLEAQVRQLQAKRDQFAQSDPADPVSEAEVERIRRENAEIKDQIDAIIKLHRAE